MRKCVRNSRMHNNLCKELFIKLIFPLFSMKRLITCAIKHCSTIRLINKHVRQNWFNLFWELSPQRYKGFVWKFCFATLPISIIRRKHIFIFLSITPKIISIKHLGTVLCSNIAKYLRKPLRCELLTFTTISLI